MNEMDAIDEADGQAHSRRRADDAGPDCQVIHEAAAEIAVSGHVDADFGAWDLEQVSPLGVVVRTSRVAKQTAFVEEVLSGGEQLESLSANLHSAVAQAEATVDVVAEPPPGADCS